MYMYIYVYTHTQIKRNESEPKWYITKNTSNIKEVGNRESTKQYDLQKHISK